MHFFMESVYIWIVISLKFLPKVPIDNKPPFFQMMVWRLTSDKSLSEPMLAYFADLYVSLGLCELRVMVAFIHNIT